MKNPLLAERNDTDKSHLPFNEIQAEHFPPAFEKSLEKARERLGQLTANPSPADFANTIEALEFSREDLDRVSSVFFNLNSAHTSDVMQAIAKDIAPKLADFANDVTLNEALFQRVKAVHAQSKNLTLTTEQKELLDKTYRTFARNGALLAAAEKEQLRALDRELAQLGQTFSENVLKATNDYQLVIKNEKDLAGLPESAITAAKETAQEKGKPDAWVFTLQAPSYIPFLQFAENEKLREEISFAYGARATKGELDNRPILLKIARLRQERARLLGFATHADFVLAERMASSPKAVWDFLGKLLEKAKPAAAKDVEDVKALKKKLTGSADFYPWDFAFYTEKLKQERYQLDEEELRPYFPLEQVVQGVFEHARRLYGLSFRARADVPVYHPDVKAFEVADESGRFMGLFYADFFPRASKRGGAWMTNFREQGTLGGKVVRPHVSIVCNFTKPTAEQPSLLTLDEVHTLFHEFGHGLHGLLSDCRYPSLAGANVYWDFVELPSQLMENWVAEKEGLALFARHYKTGAAMPDALVEKIRKAAKFQAGYQTVRQLSFALLDMTWHASDPSEITDVDAYEWKAVSPASFFPRRSGTSVSAAFSHIFSGGYSAGYYSYKWAEVLDADAFEYFKEKGLFNREVAKLFREHVLSRGGTEHPMTLYKRFRGREPDPNALLRRDGLI